MSKNNYPAEFMPTPKSLELFNQVKKNGTISICFFNNKGGVGKTTLAANLAAELSINYKAKVLVVDADPQCNLTQYALSDDEFIDLYDDEDCKESIYSVIHPLSTGKGYKSTLPIKNPRTLALTL